jgi:hypothetical protein
VLETLKGYLDQRGIKVKLWLADRYGATIALAQPTITLPIPNFPS